MKRFIILLGTMLGALVGITADWRDNGEVFRLDDLLARNDLWTITTNTIVPALRPGRFTWLDEEKTTAQGGQWMRLSFLNFPVWEAQVRLESNRVQRVELSLYNRGDADTYIGDVPMVDQGFKGYCAAAVIARLMRYYGKDFDQHDAAQLAGTTAQDGTRNLSMKDALKRLAQQNGLQFQAAQEADIQRLVTDYNLAAVLARKPKVAIQHNLDAMLLGMDRELLLKIRGRNQTATTVFKDLVSKSIANGLPVVWHVYLGLFAEPGMWPMQGAHARLIIGHNKKSGDILYTDTWGRGHELKRMNLDEAVSITLGLYVIKPNNS
jgi:hypothetical protein